MPSARAADRKAGSVLGPLTPGGAPLTRVWARKPRQAPNAPAGPTALPRIRGVSATIRNISGYRFVPLDDLSDLRVRLLAAGAAQAIKGTVLLAPEGINLAVAGSPQAVQAWLQVLQAQAGLADLELKDSFSLLQPFQHLKVKIKREIIRMDQPMIRPFEGRAPAVTAKTLARWIRQGHDDGGRPLKLLDTRNAFEVDAGAFDGALDWRLQKFSDFPPALQAHRDELAGCTVVSYCTGGIRCEKAALVMQQAGLRHSYQLEGGILRYFEDTGGVAPGWRGRCFVFDERVALDTHLQPGCVEETV
jgi:UPF0176 protein